MVTFSRRIGGVRQSSAPADAGHGALPASRYAQPNPAAGSLPPRALPRRLWGDGIDGSADISTPRLAQKLCGWALDYAYVTYWSARAVLGRGAPDQLRQPETGPRSPVLLIPGVFEGWRFMQPVARHLYRRGHPVHVLDRLGYNTGAIPDLALFVTDYLERADLHDVAIVAHSKGGLIAKAALANPRTLARVRRLIAINTPFSGSRYASLFPLPSVRMFAPTGSVIRQLLLNNEANRRITSLYSVFDPHIPETSHLEGANNIVLPTVGHFRPLAAASTLEVVTAILDGDAGRTLAG